MARRGIWSSMVVCGALALLLAAPALATEESAQEQPAEKKQADEKDAAKAASDAKQKPDAAATKAGTAAACEPGATRVNTLEDVFGAANWMALQARAPRTSASAPRVAWRDATSEAQASPKKPAAPKPIESKKTD